LDMVASARVSAPLGDGYEDRLRHGLVLADEASPPHDREITRTG
jgi:hypothetical protein